MIYQIAVVENPTKEEKENGALEKLVHEPQWFIAANEEKAKMKAAQTLLIDLENDRLEVLCRPFQ